MRACLETVCRRGLEIEVFRKPAPRRLAVRGVSVGDSQAWAILGPGNVAALTEGQSRKHLGSGLTRAQTFACTGARRVILASDGLLDAVGERALLDAESLAAWRELVPRDDATAVLVRPAPK